LKSKIQAARADLISDRQKLIHAGKVLKDEQDISELNLAESDFIVCMVTKETAKKTAPAPATAPTTAPATAAPVAPATPATASAPSVPPAAPTQPRVSASPAAQAVNTESLQALVNMGFPEADARVALTAAMGNPDVAYEFLLSGIPDQFAADQTSSPQRSAPPAQTGGAVSIEALRQHPQFNMLKQLVQQNPAALPQVLDLIGQQSPELYAAIQANNDGFIAMMNEPITDTPAAPASQPAPTHAPQQGGLGAALNDPGQMMQVLAALPPAQRAQFAQSIGIDVQELDQMLVVLNSLPPEQRQQFLGAGLAGGMGGRSPANVVHLTEEEMAAVNRLTELGFTRQQAAQAYLACDKDEQLAANFLLGGGFDDDMQDFGGGGDEHDDHDDDMYS
jgi:UV excision repair protein RAD23